MIDRKPVSIDPFPHGAACQHRERVTVGIPAWNIRVRWWVRIGLGYLQIDVPIEFLSEDDNVRRAPEAVPRSATLVDFVPHAPRQQKLIATHWRAPCPLD
jgi:hypothetical protein